MRSSPAWLRRASWRSATPSTTAGSSKTLEFSNTGVLPIAVNTERLTNAPPNPVLEEILDDGLVNFLFVGRIAPNKRIEDHIRLAEQYKRYVDAYYRFIFVGRYDVVPQYDATIRALLSDKNAGGSLRLYRPGA